MPKSPAVVHVIDDEAEVRESLLYLFVGSGFRVHTYDSASAFLPAVTPGLDGCVVTDIRMPGMSGSELIRRLKTMGVAAPVIVITGHVDGFGVAELIKAGAFGCLLKPFNPDTLVAMVREALTDSVSADGSELE